MFKNVILTTEEFISRAMEVHKGFKNTKEFHDYKSNKCLEKGYNLIHISEECWLNNKQKELNRILINDNKRGTKNMDDDTLINYAFIMIMLYFLI